MSYYEPRCVMNFGISLICVNTPTVLDQWEVSCLNLLATDFFFQILAHPVFKM